MNTININEWLLDRFKIELKKYLLPTAMHEQHVRQLRYEIESPASTTKPG